MKIAMAGDHAGFAMKAALKKRLESQGHEVVDCKRPVIYILNAT